MSEAVTLFRQALAEQGLDANVAHESDGHNDTFHVSKTIADELYTYTTTISAQAATSKEKEIVLAAREVATSFDDHLYERIRWRDRSVEISPYSRPEASCERCQTTVHLTYGASIPSLSAECTTPQPIPIDPETCLAEMDDHSRVVVKMYLLGKLRDNCEPDCPNSNIDSTERFI